MLRFLKLIEAGSGKVCSFSLSESSPSLELTDVCEAGISIEKGGDLTLYIVQSL